MSLPVTDSAAESLVRQRIARYYDNCHVAYRIGWNLDSGLSLHFGYWDETTTTLAQAMRRENEVVADRAGVGPGDRVLDAGCGVGGSAIYLAQHRGCRVVGITLSRRQLRTAARNAHRRGVDHLVEFREADYCATGFESGSFDTVWAIESFCHASDKSAFARESHRLLRPGGRLVIADGFAGRDRYEASDDAVMRAWLRGWCVESIDTVARSELRLIEAGFTHVRSEDITRHVLPSSRLIQKRALPTLPMAWPLRGTTGMLGDWARHVLAGVHQYDAIRRNLWTYAIVVADKPPTDWNATEP